MTHEVAPAFDDAALTDLLRKFFDVPEEQLRHEATFDELGLDSLGLMEVLVALEETTGVDLVHRLEDLSPATTLGEAARSIQSALAGEPR